MDIPSITRLLLRLTHALAAAAWLGGGVYYVLALRPQMRQADEEARALARAAQREFGRWSSMAAFLMVGSGVVMMWDGLADGRGTIAYVVLLAVKVAAAAVAFWLAGSFVRSWRTVPLPGRKVPRQPSRFDRAWLILMLGSVAFLLGVILSSVYPTGIGQR